ncbi:hypothetical protein [Desulforamulus aquiferis]|uniref:Uncharacterized protein n=1 Tax=Desulforamulus aquiferis TaxID=1397668 RepID=A0AAW7ZI90_9FIRM|nr:hypothetical protein [Desulforamulus aquiferis]MDO7789003.1 hypothetical protein [Desulforamulus aquiferis]
MAACPYLTGNTCELTNTPFEDEALIQKICSTSDYAETCPHLTRKVYAAKTYTFISPSKSCPYCVGHHCEIRNVNIYQDNKKYYNDVCCTSKYSNRCSYYEYRVKPIKPNKYFHASCCCPYLKEDVCEVRRINMRHKNKLFYDNACSKADYIKRCPHFMERTCKIKIKKDTFTFKNCPVHEKDRCKKRDFCVKDKCKDFYHDTCSSTKYGRCCPHYMETR